MRRSRAVAAVATAAVSIATLATASPAIGSTRALSTEVRVNQVGYATGAPKVAFAMLPAKVARVRFEVTTAYGVAYRGTSTDDLGSWNSGYRAVYQLSFSGMRTPGRYQVKVLSPASAASPSFTISDGSQLYRQLVDNAVQYFTSERDGPGVDSAVLDRQPANLTDENAYVYADPAYDSNDNLLGSLKRIGGPVDVSGGWFDAARWAGAYIAQGHPADGDTFNLYDTGAVAEAELLQAMRQARISWWSPITSSTLLADLAAQLRTGEDQAKGDPFDLGTSLGASDASPHAFGLFITDALYQKYGGSRQYEAFAQQQLNFALGANGWGSSFVVGAGTVFPHCMQSEIANLAGSLTGHGAIQLGATTDGPSSPANFTGLGTVAGMRACSAGNFAPFNTATAGYQDNVVSWPSVEPADDYTAASLLAFALGLADEVRPHWGVGVVCGAGINCVGVGPDGRVTRFLALGTTSGDWGGGYGLGLEALWHAARAEDGRGPDTLLTGYLTSHLGVDRVEDVTLGIHQGKIGEDDLTGLAPLLLRAAEAGDDVARTVVSRLADEISVMAITAMRRLGLTGLATPVVLGGGVITARVPLLIDSVLRQLSEAAPDAKVSIIDVPPVAGAALLGLDHVKAPPAAESRLRAAYDAPRS